MLKIENMHLLRYFSVFCNGAAGDDAGLFCNLHIIADV